MYVEKQKTLVAILVDGENVGQDQANLIIESAARCGTVNIRRVYGDMARLRDWEMDHRFHAVHTGHGRSKNTADINLVIDAMDLAHAGRATAFVIVSSDGDFAPLATRLREGGFAVTGIGRAQAASSFKDACSDFQCLLKADQTAPTVVPVAETPKVFVPPKLKLSTLDEDIHYMCRLHGGKAAKITLVKLGNVLSKVNLADRKAAGKSTWRAYLKSRNDYYVVDGSAETTSVRLKTP